MSEAKRGDAKLPAEVHEMWADHNRDAAERKGMAVIEHYPAGAGSEGGAHLAQRLHDGGLIVAINERILHPLGLALGVYGPTAPGDPQRIPHVQGLALWSTDGGPMAYEGDGPHERGREKLKAALEHLLATWDDPPARSCTCRGRGADPADPGLRCVHKGACAQLGP